MKTLLLLNGVVALAISFLFVIGFLKHYKRDYINHVTNRFSLIFFSYITLTILYFSWLFGFFVFSFEDYILVYAIVIFVQTVILFKMMYSFTRNRRMFCFLFSYLILFLLLNSFTFRFILLVSLIISFLLMMILFFNFVNASIVCKRVGYIGIFYTCISLIFGFVLFFDVGNLLLFGLFLNFTFLFFEFYFLRDVKGYPLRFVERISAKGESYITLFIKYFVYIIVLTNLVLISTIGVHELGHVLASRYYGCESRSIIFEEGGTYAYSEIVCDDLSGKLLIALSGPLLPIIIAVVLFIFGGRFTRPISFLVVGFNLLASYKDFLEVGVGKSLVFIGTIWGVIILFIGVALLARSRMHEYHHDMM